MPVEEMPGFESLTDHDKVELIKFEHYLHAAREPNPPIEGAYAHVYGEVIRDECGKPYEGGLCRLPPNHAGRCQE